MRHGSLFSGIGGFDLAAEWMGWENTFHCEINPFGQKVLKYYWPNSICYDDITKTDFTIWRGRIDVLTGGFPCQPFSLAGKRKGTEDERHLWPEMLRAIREIQPEWIVGENVLGIVSWDGGMVFNQVQADLEAEGYEVQPYVLPACAVNAPHRRDRVWFVAHAKDTRGSFCELGESIPGKQIQDGSNTNGHENMGIATETVSTRCQTKRELSESTTQSKRISNMCGKGVAPYTETKRLQGYRGFKENSGIEGNKRSVCIDERNSEPGNNIRGVSTWDNFPTQPPVCGRNDGVPSELAGITVSKHRNESIKAYGNAIVPQVAYQIFKAIAEYETSTTHTNQARRLQGEVGGSGDLH